MKKLNHKATPVMRFVLALLWICAMTVAWKSVAFASETAQEPKAYKLEDLVERALETHPLVQAAQADEDVFAAKLFQARWAWVPRGSLVSLFAPIPRQTDQGTSYDEWGPFTRSELNMTLPLYTFGKWDSLKALGRAGVSAAQAQKEIAEHVVRRYVYGAYTALLFGRNALEVFQDGKKHLDRAERKLEEMEEEDDDDYDPTDRLRLKIVRAEVADKEVETRTIVQNMEDALRELASLDSTDPIRLTESKLVAPSQGVPGVERCLELAWENRPEMHALGAGVRARKAAHRLARAKWYPNIALVGRQIVARAPGIEDQASAFVYDPYNHIGGGGGLVLQWDIDVVGRVAEVDEAAARVRKIQAQKDAVKMGIGLEVKKLHVHYIGQEQRVTSAKGAFRAARGWLTAKADLFDAGLVEYGDVSDAVRAYYERKIKELEARYRSMQARADISLAIGLSLPDFERAATESQTGDQEVKGSGSSE